MKIEKKCNIVKNRLKVLIIKAVTLFKVEKVQHLKLQQPFSVFLLVTLFVALF
jgi:hypothetical protein